MMSKSIFIKTTGFVIYMMLGLVQLGWGQQEFSKVYYGDHLAFDVAYKPVHVLNNSAMNALEASNSISSPYGDLLFYTDGVSVWARNHIIMPNGMNIGGHPSAKNCMIVPHPGNNLLYYIFTLGALEDAQNGELSYSVVNMELNNGYGDISERHISLNIPAIEACAVLRHCNKRDYWLVSHSYPYYNLPSNFYVFRITPDGIDPNPIASPTIEIYPRYLYLSPDGNKVICIDAYHANQLHLFQFDQQAGTLILNNSIYLNNAIKEMRFSPSGEFLYTLESEELYQYPFDSLLYNPVVSAGTKLDSIHYFVFMMDAPDDRMYLSYGGNLSVIPNPDEAFPATEIYFDTIHFYNKKNALIATNRLPQPITAFAYQTSFTWEGVCLGDTTGFTFLEPDCGSIVVEQWHFGDIYSTDTVSNLMNPKHFFTYPGKYLVTLTANDGIQSYTVQRTIEIFDNDIDLGPDQIAQQGDSIILDPGWEYYSYQWNTGDTIQTLSVVEGGDYSLTVLDRYGCTLSDTVHISYNSIADEKMPEFAIYPNPARTLLFYKAKSPGALGIYSMNGRLLMQIDLKTQQGSIDVSGLRPGTYIVKNLCSRGLFFQKLLLLK